MRRNLGFAIFSLLLLLVAAGCGDQLVVVDVTGKVTNLYGEPVAGVDVQLAGNTVKTTADGVFVFPESELEGARQEIVVSSGSTVLYSETVNLAKIDEALTIVVDNDNNLLPNPGFELPAGEKGYPLSWRTSPLWEFGKEVRLDEAQARSGKYALAIHHPEDYNRNVHVRIDEDTHTIPVKEGEAFKLTAYARNLSGKTALISIVYLDADNKEIAGTSSSASTKSTTWDRLEMSTRPAPAEARAIRVLMFSTAAQAGSVSMFDDLYLEKITP